MNGVGLAAAAARWNTDDFERGRVDDAIRADGAVRHPHPVQIGVVGFIGDCTQGRLARPAIGYGQRIISSALSDVRRSTGVIYRFALEVTRFWYYRNSAISCAMGVL